MTDRHTHIPRIVQIAARIEEDIRSRGLQPGDAYLSTVRIADMLGVSTSAANRAMQLLAKRRLLSRRQGRGAFIGEGLIKAQKLVLRAIHFLVHEHYLKAEGLLADGVIVGLQEKLPGVHVQMNFLVPGEEAEVVQRVIGTALRSGEPEGFVLVRAPVSVQRAVRNSGLPAVVHGMLYPSIEGLPWIDRDQRQAARLLVEYLLDRCHRRIVYVAREQMLPGDYVFEDAMVQRMAEAGLPLGSLVMRRFPRDEKMVRAEVLRLLRHHVQAPGASGPSAPAGQVGDALPAKHYPGFIVYSESIADDVAAAVESRGLVVGRDVVVALRGAYRPSGGKPVRYPFTRPDLAPEQVGEHIAAKLDHQMRDPHWKADYEILPVVLEEPAAEVTHKEQAVCGSKGRDSAAE